MSETRSQDSRKEKRPAGVGVFSFLLFLLFVSVLVLNIRPIAAYDFWHHLKAGQLVWETGAVAQTEPFLIPAKGMPWIQYEWLAQLLFYVIFVKIGVNALIILKAFTLAVSFVILALACRQRTDSFAIPIFVSALAALCLSGRSFVRPEFIGYLLLAFFIFFLERARRGNWLWLIPTAPLVALWANVHGSYIIGIVLLLITAAGESLRLASRRHKVQTEPVVKSKRYIRWLWAFVIICSLAACINPYGVRIFEVPFKLFGSTALSQVVVEWRPFTFAEFLHPQQIGVWILLGATLVTIARIRLTDFFILAVFFYLALKSSRNVMLFLFVCAPIFSSHLDYLKETLARIKRIPSAIERPLVGWTALVLFLVLMVWYGQGIPDMWRFGLGIDESTIPRKGADFLQRHNIKGRIFNTHELGNYLLWRLHPDNEVFVDGRIDVYGEEVLKLATAIRYAQEGWEDELDEYGITIVLIDTKTGPRPQKMWGRLGKELFKDENWALVYFDRICLIFLRRNEENKNVIAEVEEYSFYPIDFVDFGVVALSEEQFSNAMRRLRKTLKEDRENLLAKRAMGTCYLHRNDYEKAIECFSFAAERDPRSPIDAYYLGLAFMLKGNMQKAKAHFDRALLYRAPVANVYNNLGIISLEQGDFEIAIRLLKRALEFSPEDWQLHWHIAQAYEATGDLASAIDELRIVAKLKPEFEPAHNLLEQLLYPQKAAPEKDKPDQP